MEQYIKKSALVAEIESKIEKYTKRGEESCAKRDGYGMYWGGVISCLNEVRTLCDTLEETGVDLELTWEDIQLIGEIEFSIYYYEYRGKKLPPKEQVYKEILKRFKEKKK